MLVSSSSSSSSSSLVMASPARKMKMSTQKKQQKTRCLRLFNSVNDYKNDGGNNKNMNNESRIKTKSVVFVRHGQSTWNEKGIIQGSSDESVLTELGETQARRSFELLKSENFDFCLRSPLQRAYRTAEVIWGEERNKEKMNTIDDLREIDLYAFQGLDKNDRETIEKREFTSAYAKWKTAPEEFEVSGHFPVVELWERGDKCWKEYILPLVLDENKSIDSLLVVAHNAVNQSLLGNALGVGPEYFRRILQNNCGITKIELTNLSTGKGYENELKLVKLNQTGGGNPPIKSDVDGKRYVVLVASKNFGDEMNEAMGEINRIHSLLAGVPFSRILSVCSDTSEIKETECILTKGLSAMFKQNNPTECVKFEINASNRSIQSAALESTGNVLVVARDECACRQVLSGCLNVSKEVSERIKVMPGDGITIVDVSKGFDKSAVNCVNFNVSERV
jgi:broad specificity phosphatase PhoE